MAAIVAPVAILAPRAAVPKARAARSLRATTFNGVKVAQPKVSPERWRRSRKKTPAIFNPGGPVAVTSARRIRTRARDAARPVARGRPERFGRTSPLRFGANAAFVEASRARDARD